MKRSIRIATILLAAALGLAGAARADVTVSITINGSLDEIIPILELLRDMGIGTETLGDPGDPLRLNMHSVSTIEAAPGAPESAFEAVAPAPVVLQPSEPAPQPATALSDMQFTPMPAAPGSEVLLTVAVTDADKHVDTLVAQIPRVADENFDLYDNGTHGDQTATDNIWSATVTVPQATNPGEYTATVTAYDPHGDPVKADETNDAPLTIQGSLVVAR